MTCICGHSIEEHGHDPDYPGSMACTECDCLAYEKATEVERDQTHVTIPRAQYEALMALTTASQNAWELLRYQPRDLPCETETAAKLLEHALAALRAAGINVEDKVK